jgi:Ser/Thr protein kinase RdoA (MazF antagonist)
MGSATWLVSQAGRRWVAKAVTPALRAPFAGGLSVATLLDEAGIPAGAPVPTLDGRSVVDLDAASLALLTWVEGEPLTGSGADEQSARPSPWPTRRYKAPRSPEHNTSPRSGQTPTT